MRKTMKLRIKVATTGQSFGVVGYVYRGRRIVASTSVYPIVCAASAREAAEALADRIRAAKCGAS